MRKYIVQLTVISIALSVPFMGCSEKKSDETTQVDGTAAKDEGTPAEAAAEDLKSGDEVKPEAAKPENGEKAADAAPSKELEKAPAKAEKALLNKIEGANGQESRQQELQNIYALGRKGDDDATRELVNIIGSDKEPGIRATAIRVLGRTKRAELVELLAKQAASDVLPVKIEAAILLYQWGETKTAMPIMKQLSAQGVALRRAFLTGRKDGKNQYDKAAKKFLTKGLKAENVYTRLDAALGLYELGEGKKALDVFRTVMDTEETFYVRMAALNYLRHLKDDGDVRGIIELATKDKDERVSQRATQILSENKRNTKAPAAKK